jgi:hypothetical protein
MRAIFGVFVLPLLLVTFPHSAVCGARFGVEAGAERSRFASNVFRPESDWRTGFTAGAVIECPWRGPVSVVTGLRFDRRGGTQTFHFYYVDAEYGGGQRDLNGIERRWTLDYLTVPLLLRFALAQAAIEPSLEFGPEFRGLIRTTAEDEGLGSVPNVGDSPFLLIAGFRTSAALSFPVGARRGFARAGYVFDMFDLAHSGDPEYYIDWFSPHAILPPTYMNHALVLTLGLMY